MCAYFDYMTLKTMPYRIIMVICATNIILICFNLVLIRIATGLIYRHLNMHVHAYMDMYVGCAPLSYILSIFVERIMIFNPNKIVMMKYGKINPMNYTKKSNFIGPIS